MHFGELFEVILGVTTKSCLSVEAKLTWLVVDTNKTRRLKTKLFKINKRGDSTHFI